MSYFGLRQLQISVGEEKSNMNKFNKQKKDDQSKDQTLKTDNGQAWVTLHLTRREMGLNSFLETGLENVDMFYRKAFSVYNMLP